jgi:hypothetical protein
MRTSLAIARMHVHQPLRLHEIESMISHVHMYLSVYDP